MRCHSNTHKTTAVNKCRGSLGRVVPPCPVPIAEVWVSTNAVGGGLPGPQGRLREPRKKVQSSFRHDRSKSAQFLGVGNEQLSGKHYSSKGGLMSEGYEHLL